MMKLKGLDMFVYILVIVGALNWLLYAFGMNLVSMIFGFMPILETIVYVLVGLAGLYLLYMTFLK